MRAIHNAASGVSNPAWPACHFAALDDNNAVIDVEIGRAAVPIRLLCLLILRFEDVGPREVPKSLDLARHLLGLFRLRRSSCGRSVNLARDSTLGHSGVCDRESAAKTTWPL